MAPQKKNSGHALERWRVAPCHRRMRTVKLFDMPQHAAHMRNQESTMHVATQPPANLTTGQFAAAIGRSSQTIRSHHCRTGEAFGIRPRKVGRLLLWPADQVAALLDGNQKQRSA